MISDFRIATMTDSSVLYVYSLRDAIQIDPAYQRMSDVWNLDKRQLLIDSIINGFDLPKIYFHEFVPAKMMGKRTIKYAIVDGKQRLQAIWGFLDNEFPLADEFEYLHDSQTQLSGMTYGDLAKKYPLVKMRFDSKTLPIITIQTADIELIEDMFSRLNEAVPLNAPEKRNAFGGPLPKIIRTLAKNPFFNENLPFGNSRYRHYDLATKFLYFAFNDDFADTKKVYLDAFVEDFRAKKEAEAKKLQTEVTAVLKAMGAIFVDGDFLLRSIGMVMIYYLLFQFARNEAWFRKLDRNVLVKFQNAREANRFKAETSIKDADYDLLEFDRLTQSPNDAVAMKFRYSVLEKFVKKTVRK